MLKNYFTIAWRNLVKTKGYSFINIGGLALGMSVALIIGLWDKEDTNYRTTSVNVIIELTRLLSNNSGEEKSGQPKKNFDLSASVPKEGIEPSNQKSCSTKSA